MLNKFVLQFLDELCNRQPRCAADRTPYSSSPGPASAGTTVHTVSVSEEMVRARHIEEACCLGIAYMYGQIGRWVPPRRNKCRKCMIWTRELG